jgi:hypothetical protein
LWDLENFGIFNGFNVKVAGQLGIETSNICNPIAFSSKTECCDLKPLSSMPKHLKTTFIDVSIMFADFSPSF